MKKLIDANELIKDLKEWTENIKNIRNDDRVFFTEENILDLINKQKAVEYAEEAKIPFPFQYLEQYFLGELNWDDAIDNTMDEAYRLIEKYAEKHGLKIIF
jgi:hypothetical protein